MTERPNVPVLKTGVARATVGSNPTLSAIYLCSMATKRNKKARKVKGRAEGIRLALVDKAEYEASMVSGSTRWAYLSRSMKDLVAESEETRVIDESTVSDCIKFLRSQTLSHFESGKYGLCRVLVAGLEFWLHSKHRSREMKLFEVYAHLGAPVKLSEVLDPKSTKHPWSPGHEWGKDFWDTMISLFKILESEKVSVEDKIMVLEKFKLPHGLVCIKSLMTTNYFGGQ